MTVTEKDVRRRLTDEEIDRCFEQAAELIREVREQLRGTDKRPTNLPRMR